MASKDEEHVNSKISSPVAVPRKERVARLEWLKGEVTSRHCHPVEVTVIGLSGVWRFYLDDRSFTVGKDQVLRIPAGVKHRAEALTDAIALNISASSEAQSCNTFLQPKEGVAIPNDSLQDPDQYLWGV